MTHAHPTVGSRHDHEPDKPRWRGLLHQWAAIYALGAGTGLIMLAPSARARIAAGVYALSLAILFGVSALYHRVTWRPRARMWYRRADHASIFLLIGGTYTPVALLGVGGTSGKRLLLAVWGAAVVGVLVSLFWPRAPKFVSAALAVAVGWTVVPYLGAVRQALAPSTLWLIVAGGIAYTAGAVIYAAQRPNPNPRVFGYHEVFHACTLVGAGLHLASVATILR